MVRLLLATDFDGTIASIRATPDEVTVDPALAEVLTRASARPDIAVAVLSGRDLADLRRRLGGLRAYLSGSHGHEISGLDGETIRGEPAWNGSPDPGWVERARRAGIRLEPKRYGIAIHWRGAEGIDESAPLVREFAEWASGAGMALISGRRVLEARLPGSDKRKALEELRDLTDATRVVYAGDDLTDFGALEWAASHGRALFIESDERHPPRGVEILTSRDELLVALRQEIEALD